MNLFKKFCINFVVLLILLLLIVHPALFYANLGNKNSPGQTISNWFKIKDKYTRDNPGKKLFILSGSSTLFGVDTEFMERELGITVVNFGTHAGLKKYMFEHVKALLNSGDIILMPLEHSIYRDNIPGEDALAYILEYEPEYFRNMAISDKISCIFGVKSSLLLKSIFEEITNRDYAEDTSSIYSSVYLNANGDLTSNKYSTRTYKKPSTNARQNFPNEDIPSRKMERFLADFAEYCRVEHIKLYITWPPLYSITGKKEFYGHDAKVINGIISLWNANNVPILGDYRDALFDADDCYNMPSHLNERGKAKYTEHLIELIRPYI